MDSKPRSDPPHGMEPYDVGDSHDLGALSQEQQTQLNNFKVPVYAFHAACRPFCLCCSFICIVLL